MWDAPLSTKALLLGTAACWVVYDLFAEEHYGMRGTISAAVIDIGKRWPIIPFAAGMLMGHFFWEMDNGRVL